MHLAAMMYRDLSDVAVVEWYRHSVLNLHNSMDDDWSRFLVPENEKSIETVRTQRLVNGRGGCNVCGRIVNY